MIYMLAFCFPSLCHENAWSHGFALDTDTKPPRGLSHSHSVSALGGRIPESWKRVLDKLPKKVRLFPFVVSARGELNLE